MGLAVSSAVTDEDPDTLPPISSSFLPLYGG